MFVVEAAYKRANNALGIIPENASAALVAACNAGRIDIEELGAVGSDAGAVIISLLAGCVATCPIPPAILDLTARVLDAHAQFNLDLRHD